MTIAAMDFGGLELDELILAGDNNAWSLDDWNWDGNSFSATPKTLPASAPRRGTKRRCSGAHLGPVGDQEGSKCQTWMSAVTNDAGINTQACGSTCCPGRVANVDLQQASCSPAPSDKQQAASPASSMSGPATPHAEPATAHSELVLPTGPMVCQVEGCGRELSSLSVYYQRCRICEVHIKKPEFMRAGKVQRFCQQCGRCHELSAFQGAKRSCRDQLAKHNARRRRRADTKNAAVAVAEIQQQEGALPASSPCSSRLADHFASLGPFLQPLDTRQEGGVALTSEPFLSQQLSGEALVSQPLLSAINGSVTVDSMGSILLPAPQGKDFVLDAYQPQASLGVQLPSSFGYPSSYFPDDQAVSMPLTSTALPAPSEGILNLVGRAMSQPGVAIGIPVEQLGKVSTYEQALAMMAPQSSTMPPALPPQILPSEAYQSTGPTSAPHQALQTLHPKPYQPENLVARLSVKLFSCTPAELPQDLQQQLTGWLRSTPAGAEGYLKPGCVHLTLQAHISADCAAEVAEGGIQAVAAHLASQADLVWHRRAILLELNGQVALLKAGRLVSCWDLPSLRTQPHLAPKDLPSGSQIRGAAMGGDFVRPAASFRAISELEQPRKATDVKEGSCLDDPHFLEVGVIQAEHAGSQATLSAAMLQTAGEISRRDKEQTLLQGGVISKPGSVTSVVPQLMALSRFAVAVSGEVSEGMEGTPRGTRVQLLGRGIACADCTVLCRLRGRYVKLAGGLAGACCQPGEPHYDQEALQSLDVWIPHDSLAPGVAWVEVQRGCLLSRPLPLIVAPAPALTAELEAHWAAGGGGGGGDANAAGFEGLAGDLGLLMSRHSEGADLSPLASTAARLMKYAADASLPELARFLLTAAGRLCFVQSPPGTLTLLHRCARSRRVAVLETLLRWGENEGYVWQADAPGPNGITPLHLAALASDGGLLAHTLASRCQPGPIAWRSARTIDGATPADYAVRAGAFELDTELTALSQEAAWKQEVVQPGSIAGCAGRMEDSRKLEGPAAALALTNAAEAQEPGCCGMGAETAWRKADMEDRLSDPPLTVSSNGMSLVCIADVAPEIEAFTVVDVASEDDSSLDDESSVELKASDEAGEMRMLLANGGHGHESCAAWGGPLSALGPAGVLGKWSNVSLLAMLACTFACMVLLRDWVV